MAGRRGAGPRAHPGRGGHQGERDPGGGQCLNAHNTREKWATMERGEGKVGTEKPGDVLYLYA